MGVVVRVTLQIALQFPSLPVDCRASPSAFLLAPLALSLLDQEVIKNRPGLFF